MPFEYCCDRLKEADIHKSSFRITNDGVYIKICTWDGIGEDQITFCPYCGRKVTDGFSYFS